MTDQRFLDMLRGCPDALESRQRFMGLLKDCFPQEPALVNVMALLHDLGAHTEIAKTDSVTRDLAFRFTKRLVDGYGIDSGRAETVVALFCTCYAEAIGKPCDLTTIEKAETDSGQAPSQLTAPLQSAGQSKPNPAPGSQTSKGWMFRRASPRGFAIGSLAYGIISILGSVAPLFFLLLSSMGLWMGFTAKRELAEKEAQTGMATAGIVLNIIALVLGVLFNIGIYL